LLYWFGPLQGRLWPVALLSAFMGGAVEFLQLLVGRQALFKDFLLDLVGIGIVVGWVLWQGHGRRAGQILFLVLLVSIPVQLYYLPMRIAATYHCQALFPVLADFERGTDRYLWSRNMESNLTFAEVPDTPTGPGRVLRLEGGPPEDWPGAVMKRFPHDWSAYRVLKFEVRLVSPTVTETHLSLRLDDYPGLREGTWVYQRFLVTTTWQTMTMPLVDRPLFQSDRNLDLTQIDKAIFYFGRPESMQAVEIDNLRLE